MNQVTSEQKDSVTKSLAIVGFVAAILFTVWLAVQIVGIIPSAFSSLASIADGVYNYSEDQTLTVTTKNSVVNSGEAFTLSWTKMSRPGTYAFSYQCTEGASAQVRDVQGDIVALDCATLLTLGEKTSLDVIINSEKQRFTDVTYTVAYQPQDVSKNTVDALSQITIVNASIPTYPAEGAVETTTQPEVGTGEVAGESTTVVPETNTGLVAGEPTTIEEIIYAIPVSDPNGVIDLKMTYLGVGSLTGKIFRREANINTDEQGAFQFAVQNMGTKTSLPWTFVASLPSGIEYTSGPQVVLKPNEKAIITIGFEGLTQVGVERFGAELSTKNDQNTNNNSFTWAVEVVK